MCDAADSLVTCDAVVSVGALDAAISRGACDATAAYVMHDPAAASVVHDPAAASVVHDPAAASVVQDPAAAAVGHDTAALVVCDSTAASVMCNTTASSSSRDSAASFAVHDTTASSAMCDSSGAHDGVPAVLCAPATQPILVPTDCDDSHMPASASQPAASRVDAETAAAAGWCELIPSPDAAALEDDDDEAARPCKRGSQTGLKRFKERAVQQMRETLPPIQRSRGLRFAAGTPLAEQDALVLADRQRSQTQETLLLDRCVALLTRAFPFHRSTVLLVTEGEAPCVRTELRLTTVAPRAAQMMGVFTLDDVPAGGQFVLDYPGYLMTVPEYEALPYHFNTASVVHVAHCLFPDGAQKHASDHVETQYVLVGLPSAAGPNVMCTYRTGLAHNCVMRNDTCDVLCSETQLARQPVPSAAEACAIQLADDGQRPADPTGFWQRAAAEPTEFSRTAALCAMEPAASTDSPAGGRPAAAQARKRIRSMLATSLVYLGRRLVHFRSVCAIPAGSELLVPLYSDDFFASRVRFCALCLLRASHSAEPLTKCAVYACRTFYHASCLGDQAWRCTACCAKGSSQPADAPPSRANSPPVGADEPSDAGRVAAAASSSLNELSDADRVAASASSPSNELSDAGRVAASASSLSNEASDAGRVAAAASSPLHELAMAAVAAPRWLAWVNDLARRVASVVRRGAFTVRVLRHEWDAAVGADGAQALLSLQRTSNVHSMQLDECVATFLCIDAYALSPDDAERNLPLVRHAFVGGVVSPDDSERNLPLARHSFAAESVARRLVAAVRAHELAHPADVCVYEVRVVECYWIYAFGITGSRRQTDNSRDQHAVAACVDDMMAASSLRVRRVHVQQRNVTVFSLSRGPAERHVVLDVASSIAASGKQPRFAKRALA